MQPSQDLGLDCWLLPFSRQDELTGFKSWLHRHPPPPPTPPPTPPTALRLHPPTLRRHHPPSLPPHSFAIVPTWPPLVRVSAIVPTWLPLVQVFKSLVCPNPLRPHRPHRPHHPHRPQHFAQPLYVVTTITLTAPHRSPFTPLPLSPPARPWFGFSSLEKVFEASKVCPNPLRPHPPHRPHRPQRFVHPHRHQRFARHSTSSPPSPSLPPPLTAFILCHCPHLVALGSGLQVFKKDLEASNVCPNPVRPRRPTALSASSTPTASSASPTHSTSSPPSPSLPPPLTAFTPRPLSPPGRPWFRSLPLSPPGRPWCGFRSNKPLDRD